MTVQKNIPQDYMPILSIMIKPRQAFKYVLEHKKASFAIYTGAIGGFASSIATLYGSAYPAGYSLGQIVYSSVVTGILIFMLSNLLLALFLNVVGSAVGGKGTFKVLFQTMCLTVIPYIWLLPILLFWMQLAPKTFFKLSESITLAGAIGSYFGAFAIVVASIWAIVLSVIGISETHGFSKWKAFFTLLIASIAVVLIMSGIAMFVL